MDERLIESLTAAVRAAPDDLTLRLHLAGLLVDADRGAEAVEHVATVLATEDPSRREARALMARADGRRGRVEALRDGSRDAPPSHRTTRLRRSRDLRLARRRVRARRDGRARCSSTARTDEPGPSAYDVERAGVRLADVGGLTEVKKRLEASFLAPLRNPELRALYGKSLRGGLLLYGPPGCGKTFLAKAVAGELGAAFMHVSLADILDMYIGQSERNVKELFEVARTSAPCVLFLDELDAHRPEALAHRAAPGRATTVNQLLTELDGVGSDNEGVFVLAATNHPWDVDPALRRPGRLDRTLLVLPPDRDAREAILRTHLRERPVEGIDTRKPGQGHRGLQRRRPGPPVRVGLRERADGLGRHRARCG